MKAHVVVAPFFMDETGQDVLAGVLLHIVEALFPVHRAGYLFTYGKRGRQKMCQRIVFVNGDMQYGEGCESTAVGALAAFFGEKAVRSKMTAKQSFTGTQESTVASNWVIWGFVSYIFSVILRESSFFLQMIWIIIKEKTAFWQ